MIYQEEQEIRLPQPENASFATIAGIYEDGVTLLFGNETTPSQKRYRCNSSAVFREGDRVLLAKDSGTYVVMFPVGAPKTSSQADSAAQAQTAVYAQTARQAAYAEEADYALVVRDQLSPTARYIQFRVTGHGQLQFRSSYFNSGVWYNMDGSN